MAGEDGDGCRWADGGEGGGGGEGNLRLGRKGACTSELRVVGLGPGYFRCPSGVVCGVAVSVRKKASRVASPPLIMRMGVGPWGEGANRTIQIVSGGGGAVCRPGSAS